MQYFVILGFIFFINFSHCILVFPYLLIEKIFEFSLILVFFSLYTAAVLAKIRFGILYFSITFNRFLVAKKLFLS